MILLVSGVLIGIPMLYVIDKMAKVAKRKTTTDLSQSLQ